MNRTKPKMPVFNKACSDCAVEVHWVLKVLSFPHLSMLAYLVKLKWDRNKSVLNKSRYVFVITL